MELSDFINLERGKILEEKDNFYRVTYQNRIYEITKSTETCFFSSTTSSTDFSAPLKMGLQQRAIQTQQLIPGHDIFQDENVPQEYKEIMMFHEIRQKWYQEELGFPKETAHELTLHDELLYTLKFFDKKTRKGYLEFAKEYRSKAKQKKSKIMNINELYQQWRNAWIPDGSYPGSEELFQLSYDALGEKILSREEFESMNKQVLNLVKKDKEYSKRLYTLIAGLLAQT